jgi:hypothetical protein
MGIVTGLKNLNDVIDKPGHDSSEGSKAKWVKLEDGESVKVRFLQELDPDSPTYDAKNGLGFIAIEHTNPADYRRKALCSIDDQGKCFGCEEHRKDYKAGWKGKPRLYINVLVDNGKEDPFVAVLSQGISGKTITPTLNEYAKEMGSITNLMWRIKRTGLKTDTSYTIIPLQKDETPFDSSTVELYDLMTTAVRDLPYTEQEAFFSGELNKQEGSSATDSSLDW